MFALVRYLEDGILQVVAKKNLSKKKEQTLLARYTDGHFYRANVLCTDHRGKLAALLEQLRQQCTVTLSDYSQTIDHDYECSTITGPLLSSASTNIAAHDTGILLTKEDCSSEPLAKGRTGQVTDDLRTGVQDIKFSSTDVSFSLLDDFELGQAVTVQTTSPVQQIDIENSHAYNGKIVDIGACGKEGDSNIFKESTMGKSIDSNNFNIPGEQCLMGTNICYYRICRARRVSENAFGLLSQIFRIFYTPISINPDTCIDLIMTACCLHNLLREEYRHKIGPALPNNWSENSLKLNMEPLRRSGGFAKKIGLWMRELADYFSSEQGKVCLLHCIVNEETIEISFASFKGGVLLILEQLKDGLPTTVTGFAVGNDEFENICPENLDTATGLTDFEISTPTPEDTGVGLNLVNYNSSVRPPLPATATYVSVLHAVNDLAGYNSQLSDIFRPSNYNSVLHAVNDLAGYNSDTGKYDVPSVATRLGGYIRKCCDMFIVETIKSGDIVAKRSAKDFLKIFLTDSSSSIYKTATETQNYNKRNKVVELPQQSDVNKLSSFLLNQITHFYRLLSKQFSVDHWSKLLKYILCYTQQFNRKWAGEIERLLIKDFQSFQSLDKERSSVLYNALNDTERHLADNFVKIDIRGKLGRTVPILIQREHMDIIQFLLSSRQRAGVSDNNPYVFGSPSSENSSFRACQAMKTCAFECGASEPNKLRGTTLKKHLAHHSPSIKFGGE
ncbi:hypothetical protein QE152_g13487 [Popillia japonica]|uniref:DDE Tnp4 domain-containing protein n=1 Tax=Popillia japonica TaxID=7064 RepID=A0AAW1LBS5_POPJA